MRKCRDKTVLVVDNDEELTNLIAFVLEEQGYRVQRACNGQQGLDVVANSMPDLILLDINMPVMNGWEFAREFRARYDHQMPIVVMTSAFDNRRRSKDMGATEWVDKPFDLDTLLNVVGRYVEG